MTKPVVFKDMDSRIASLEGERGVIVTLFICVLVSLVLVAGMVTNLKNQVKTHHQTINNGN